MDIISTTAARMGRLIDDLLAFSQLGRAGLATRDVDLAALVQDIVAELEPDTKDRAVRWHIEDLPSVRGDPAMLRVVLVNLLTNALKFTRGRAPAEITVEAGRGATDTVVSVRDNGIGFDPRYADRLFGVFHRLHSDDQYEGTGIGLANVRRIVARHGGRTWAEGVDGRGATFFFSLPGR